MSAFDPERTFEPSLSLGQQRRAPMRYLSAYAALAIAAVCNCAVAAEDSSAPIPGQRPAWQLAMERARRLAASGEIYLLRWVKPPGIYVFNNNPHPLCYMYMVPGDWGPAEEPGLFRPKQNRASGALVGVLFWHASGLEAYEGMSLPERAATRIKRLYEKSFGQLLTGSELAPFESARPGTWRWRTDALITKKGIARLPTKVLVDLSPDAVAVVTVGFGDEESMARHVIATIKTTKEPDCYLPYLERLLKEETGDH